MKKIAILIACYIPLFGCVAHRSPKYRFPKDPYVVYTAPPEPGQLYYCEKKKWGGANCKAMLPEELAKKAAAENLSLVCAQEKGFTKTCWRAEDIDDHGAYSY